MPDPVAGREQDRTDAGAAGRPAGGGAPIRIPRELELSAAARLMGEAGGRPQAARRMVTAAAMHGIDLSWMWGTVDRAGGRPVRVRQVCLVVPGSGRTAMCILSGPVGRDSEQDHQERVAAVRAACGYLDDQVERDIRLAQALPEPGEAWAVRAFLDAGFIRVGDLAYLRRPRPVSTMPPEPISWPEGVEVRPVAGVGEGDPDRVLLLEALERSYEQTLDCPELCGLRETRDVLDSHRATGVFDAGLWWLVLYNGRAHGCVLLNRCPDHGTVELVYLGLSPELRAKRLGTALLRMGLAKLDASGGVPVTCAVDLRNMPALRLYERLGFQEFGRRVALVRPVRLRAIEHAAPR